jgi:RNA polymerase primary sigma factor
LAGSTLRGTQRWGLTPPATPDGDASGQPESPAVSSASVDGVPFDGVDVAEWDELVGRGRKSGAVHAEDIAHVLRHIELSGEVLTEVQSTMAGQGIQIDDEVDHIADDTPSGGGRRVVVERERVATAADHDEELLSRGRGRRTRKAGPKGDNSTSDTVRLYLREIGQVDLLTVEDERRLAQLIEEGKIAAARIDEKVDASAFGPGEERMLLRAVSRGERAKSELTQANLRLVVSIAKRYVRPWHAAARSDPGGKSRVDASGRQVRPQQGFKFSTYATWWIRQAITRSIADQARTIRIPVHMVEHMNRVTRAKRQMHQELEREPTVDELAEKVQLPPDRVRELLRISQDPLSLDSPVGDEDERTSAISSRTSRSTAPPTPPPA